MTDDVLPLLIRAYNAGRADEAFVASGGEPVSTAAGPAIPTSALLAVVRDAETLRLVAPPF